MTTLKPIDDIEDINFKNKVKNLSKEKAIRCLDYILFNKHESLIIDDKFMNKLWKIAGQSMSRSILISWYKQLCIDGYYEYDKYIIDLLCKKKVRVKFGVLVVAQTLSPFPEIDFTIEKDLWYKLYNENIKYSGIKNEDIISNNKQLSKLEKEKLTYGQFGCKYDCGMCPKMPNYPRSYIPGEPALDRAVKEKYDPQLQMLARLNMYSNIGFTVDKLEVILLGGTLESYFGKKIHGEEYFEWYVKNLYYAANTFNDSQPKRDILTLKEERNINRTKIPHIIGLTIESRPDNMIKSLLRYRNAGVTRIQIGIQHYGSIYSDRILDRIDRRCNTKDTENAIKTAKRNCFKIDGHFMADLPQPLKYGLNYRHIKKLGKQLTINDIDESIDMLNADLEMYHEITYGTECQCDQHKNYPTATMDWTDIKSEFENKLYKPYGENKYTANELNEIYNYSEYPLINDWSSIINNDFIDLEEYKYNFYSFMHEFVVKEIEYQNKQKKNNNIVFNVLEILLVYIIMHVRPWVRINRTVRDIPESYVIGGIKKSNTNQYLVQYMKRHNWKSNCLRFRTITEDEIKKYILENEFKKKKNIKFRNLQYISSDGLENFMEYYLDIDGYYKCIGFLRLRFDKMSGYDYKDKLIFPELKDCALIRELHVYGNVLNTNSCSSKSTQHQGYGTKLLKKAIELSQSEGFNKIAVIAGDGVKNYYANKYNFIDEGSFLIKYI